MEQELKKNTESIIQQVVSELVDKMGFPSQIEIKKWIGEEENEEEVLICDIKNDDPRFLIGQYGVNLQSLQHIARLLVRRKTEERANFIVDVNSYRQEKNSALEKLAKEMADQAVREKRAVVMRSMPAYERRIVHMELFKNNHVKTESVGEGEERKVIIRPVDIVE